MLLFWCKVITTTHLCTCRKKRLVLSTCRMDFNWFWWVQRIKPWLSGSLFLTSSSLFWTNPQPKLKTVVLQSATFSIWPTSLSMWTTKMIQNAVFVVFFLSYSCLQVNMLWHCIVSSDNLKCLSIWNKCAEPWFIQLLVTSREPQINRSS